MTWSGQYIEQQGGGRTAKRAQGSQEDAECLARSRVAWRRPSRKEVAEQLGGQQVARGRRASRMAPGAKRTPEGPGRQAARRAHGDQKDAEFRVARKVSSSLGCTDQSGAGVAEWAGLPALQLVGRERCSACGAVLDSHGCCCVRNSVTGLHSITNQASFVAKREERTLGCSM